MLQGTRRISSCEVPRALLIRIFRILLVPSASGMHSFDRLNRISLINIRASSIVATESA